MISGQTLLPENLEMEKFLHWPKTLTMPGACRFVRELHALPEIAGSQISYDEGGGWNVMQTRYSRLSHARVGKYHRREFDIMHLRLFIWIHITPKQKSAYDIQNIRCHQFEFDITHLSLYKSNSIKVNVGWLYLSYKSAEIFHYLYLLRRIPRSQQTWDTPNVVFRVPIEFSSVHMESKWNEALQESKFWHESLSIKNHFFSSQSVCFNFQLSLSLLLSTLLSTNEGWPDQSGKVRQCSQNSLTAARPRFPSIEIPNWRSSECIGLTMLKGPKVRFNSTGLWYRTFEVEVSYAPGLDQPGPKHPTTHVGGGQV